MDLEKIRKMSNEELEKYLKSLTNKNITCAKCGKNNPNYTINIKNKEIYQQKKLCHLCNKCYNELLDYLGVCDILWD
jgi:transposase-like protein